MAACAPAMVSSTSGTGGAPSWHRPPSCTSRSVMAAVPTAPAGTPPAPWLPALLTGGPGPTPAACMAAASWEVACWAAEVAWAAGGGAAAAAPACCAAAAAASASSSPTALAAEPATSQAMAQALAGCRARGQQPAPARASHTGWAGVGLAFPRFAGWQAYNAVEDRAVCTQQVAWAGRWQRCAADGCAAPPPAAQAVNSIRQGIKHSSGLDGQL